MKPAGVAFFDLDRTVLDVNSASLWVRREVREGYVTLGQALRAGMWIGAYHLGFARMEQAIRDAIASLAGREEAALRARTRAFWEEEVLPAVRPAAREAVARHHAAGELAVLLTSSSVYLSELAAAELGLDGFLCNRFEVRDGRFTGAAVEPLCFGPGKLVHARAFLDERGLSLDRAAFYTDSVSDLPVLEAVGRPVAVTPDPRLAREARRRGWPVEDWSPGA